MFRTLPALLLAGAVTIVPLHAQESPAQPTLVDGPAADSAARPLRTWRIDANHSDVSFRVRHLVTRVSGTFDRWTADLQADPSDWSTGSVVVTIETASINTRQERRDGHLRSDDFFDAERHPAITFRSRRVTAEGERLRIEGDLTIRGITRPVVLDGEIIALTTAPDGSYRAGFSATTRINRHDFGVSWNRAAEGGGLVLADDVDIEINLAAAAPAQ
jgi:polyisoprenoid-binding protein YceI